MSKNAHWTQRQLKRLREGYAVMSWAEMLVEFAPHSASSISATASDMGLRRRVGWRDWDAIAKAHVPVFSFGRAREAAE